MEGTIFTLKGEYVNNIKRLNEEETRKLMIDLVKSKKDLTMLETGDTMVRLINNGDMIEVRKISKVSFYDIKQM
jgi:DNA-directed RNA polymerase subunit H (RpoH/RPB5)